jgi:hypothetical protein
MKVITTLFILLTLQGAAQPVAQLPPGAETFYNKAMPVIKPAYQNLVMQTAIGLRGKPVNVDSLMRAFRSNAMLTSLSQPDATALVQLVLTQLAKDSEAKLQTDKQSLQAITQMHQQQRDIPNATPAQKATIDSIRQLQQQRTNAMAEMQAKQFKTEQDRNAAMLKALAALLQITAGTQDKIIKNLQ